MYNMCRMHRMIKGAASELHIKLHSVPLGHKLSYKKGFAEVN